MTTRDFRLTARHRQITAGTSTHTYARNRAQNAVEATPSFEVAKKYQMPYDLTPRPTGIDLRAGDVAKE
jgi:hypothetical protein